jgi:hydrogenase maturation protease
MNPDRIRAIADAVLYEGCLLYPYRPSALKNRSQGWSFGTLLPPSYAAKNPGESDVMQAEVLFLGGRDALLSVEARFLQLQLDSTGVIERSVAAQSPAGDLIQSGSEKKFQFGPSEHCRCVPIEGAIRLAVEPCAQGSKLTVRVSNQSELPDRAATRDEALTGALIAAHALITLEGGKFVSLLDPPEAFSSRASECRQVGVFPVMVGDETEQNAMLLSPIILYDYPQIAPQSKGDFFDSSEVDELLSLRVLTLSDAEKAEIRATGGMASRILERTEALSSADFAALHGLAQHLPSGEGKR